MADYLELLDYDEEDLNSDLNTVASISDTHLQDFEMAEEVMEDLRNRLDSHVHTEICYSRNMDCPVPGCSVSNFSSKAKFSRHWNEKHVPTSVKYHCSVNHHLQT